MAKFCGKCGSKLDEKTGLCPKCDETEKQITSFSIDKADQSVGKRKKSYKIKALVVMLISLICIGIVWGGYQFNYFDLPNYDNNVNMNSDYMEKNIPKTDMSGFKYSATPEEHIVVDENMEFVDNEILVTLTSNGNKSEFEDYIENIGGKIVGEIPDLLDYQIRLEKRCSYEELEEIRGDIESQNWAQYVSINYVLGNDAAYYPDDKLWARKWSVIPEDGNWGMEAIDAPGAWDYRESMSAVNVGVFDNMFDENHEDLLLSEHPLGNTIALNDAKWNDHGTHTSGTIAASFNNGKGVSGVSIKNNLYGVSVNGLGGTLQDWKIALFYLIAEKECSVINISLGNDLLTFNASRQCEAALKELEEIAQGISGFLGILIDKGYQFVICKSAGNQNDSDVKSGYKYFLKDDDDKENPYTYISYVEYEEYLKGDVDNDLEKRLSRYKERKSEIKKRLEFGNVDAEFDVLGAINDQEVASRIIIVGAVENKGTHRDGLFGIIGSKEHDGYTLASFSQCGDRVDVLAPGVAIQSTVKDGYGENSGTSMAAPHVAGVASLVFSVNPELKSDQVKKIICDTALGEYGSDNKGIVNAKNAVEIALKYQQDDKNSQKELNDKQNPAARDERDIVLTLDTSSSMSGQPLEETKEASIKFVDIALAESANVGIVTYEGSAEKQSDFTRAKQTLNDVIDELNSNGNTNMEDGLKTAYEILEKGHAKKKIIVLMSDGEPNAGKIGEELISYANKIKDNGVIIYTLGFFENMSGSKTNAQILMERIASEGCHYEVANAEDLIFFFDDIADQINGQRYIYVRIACPVDVTISYGGEMLSSDESNLNTRTEFGSLTFEESKTDSNESADNRIKILRLKEGGDYNIQILGTDRGEMNYTIGFMDDEGEYSDFRTFEDIPVTNRTVVDTTAIVDDKTILNIDNDGDGRYDVKMRAEANGLGEEVFIIPWRYIIAIGVALVGGIIMIDVLRRKYGKQRM